MTIQILDKKDLYAEADITGYITPTWNFYPEYEGDRLKKALFESSLAKVMYGRFMDRDHDHVWITQNDGGGYYTIPFSVDPANGKIYIGLLSGLQPLQDENYPVQFVPRTLAGPDGNQGLYGFKRILLEGEGVNPENTFFDTRGAGMQFVALQVPFSILKPNNDKKEGYILDEGKIKPEYNVESIKGAVFIEDNPTRFTSLGDGKTIIAYAKWFAWRQIQQI